MEGKVSHLLPSGTTYIDIHSNTEMKKDPGIPNLFPFKEQLLKQMEDRKARIEETKVRQKAQRQKEQTKRRSLQGLTNDAQKRTREFEKKVRSLLIIASTLPPISPQILRTCKSTTSYSVHSGTTLLALYTT